MILATSLQSFTVNEYIRLYGEKWKHFFYMNDEWLMIFIFPFFFFFPKHHTHQEGEKNLRKIMIVMWWGKTNVKDPYRFLLSHNLLSSYILCIGKEMLKKSKYFFTAIWSLLQHQTTPHLKGRKKKEREDYYDDPYYSFSLLMFWFFLLPPIHFSIIIKKMGNGVVIFLSMCTFWSFFYWSLIDDLCFFFLQYNFGCLSCCFRAEFNIGEMKRKRERVNIERNFLHHTGNFLILYLYLCIVPSKAFPSIMNSNAIAENPLYYIKGSKWKFI